MAPAGRRRAERRDLARRRLLAAVEQLIEEGTPFHAIRVEALATRAGMSRAGFYIHFQDKVELLEDWLVEARDELMSAMRAWYAADPPTNRDALRATVHQVLLTHHSRAHLMRACRESALRDATLRAGFAAAFDEHVTALTAHIEAAQASGRVSVTVPARETAEWLICMFERVPAQIPPSVQREELVGHARAAAGIIWTSLYDTAPSGEPHI